MSPLQNARIAHRDSHRQPVTIPAQTTASHTPMPARQIGNITNGPWLNDGGIIRKNYHASNIIIARIEMPVSQGKQGPEYPQCSANCRLISAAPDLLSALIDVYSAMSDLPDFHKEFTGKDGWAYIPSAVARSAITQATQS